MEPEVSKLIRDIACRFADDPRNKCMIASTQLVDALRDSPIVFEDGDLQIIGVRNPTGRTQSITGLAPIHFVVQIRQHVADTTWGQVDRDSTSPWRVYDSLTDLGADWRCAFYEDSTPRQPLDIGHGVCPVPLN